MACRFSDTPAGHLVYSDARLQVYEVEGTAEPKYCKDLCAFGKAYIQCKLDKCDVKKFNFYVFYQGSGPSASDFSFMGYFSKEIDHPVNNLSCIMLLPPYYKKGLGQQMISFSYLLSVLEVLIGSPEKPFTKDGQKSYEKYWDRAITELLQTHFSISSSDISIISLSSSSGMSKPDVFKTLKRLKFVSSNRAKVVKKLQKALVRQY